MTDYILRITDHELHEDHVDYVKTSIHRDFDSLVDRALTELYKEKIKQILAARQSGKTIKTELFESCCAALKEGNNVLYRNTRVEIEVKK